MNRNKLKYTMVFLTILGSTLLIQPKTVLAKEHMNVQRLYGADRYKTAISISKNGWNNSEYVILASGENFPDALCAAPLSKKYNAPILLTSKNLLSRDTLNEIKRLNPNKIFIMGKEGAISSNVENELKELSGISIERIGGDDRYDTSLQVAKLFKNPDETFLVSGENYPDALSVASIASKKNIPILLTSKTSLPEHIKDYINNNNIDKTYIIGGENVVNSNVKKQLLHIQTIAGKNRYDTNLKVLNIFSKDLKFEKIFLAASGNRKNDFADALTGSALAAKNSSAVILISSNGLTNNQKTFIQEKLEDNSKIILLGGEKILSKSVVENIFNSQDENNDTTKDNEIDSLNEFKRFLSYSLKNSEKEVTMAINDYDKNKYDIKTINELLIEEPDLSYAYEGVTGSISNGNKAGQKVLSLNFKYSLSKQEMDRQREAVNNKVSEIIRKIIKSDMSDYEKELAIHDYIINNSYYDKENVHRNLPEDHNPYGILVEGNGVCDSYARAFKLLLDKVGIENVFITGESKGQPHAWNKVKLDGEWYNVDLTWDDPITSNNSDGILRHTYFNIPDRIFYKNHKEDEYESIPYYKATASKYNYINMGEGEISSKGNSMRIVEDKEELIDKISDKLEDGRSYIPLEIRNAPTDSDDFEEYFKKAFREAANDYLNGFRLTFSLRQNELYPHIYYVEANVK